MTVKYILRSSCVIDEIDNVSQVQITLSKHILIHTYTRTSEMKLSQSALSTTVMSS